MYSIILFNMRNAFYDFIQEEFEDTKGVTNA